MRGALLIWLAGSALGALLVALLPETWLGGAPLFRLSERHGPSAADAIGLAIAIGAWLYYVSALWTRRRMLRPRWAVAAYVVTALAASAACIAAVTKDEDVLAAAMGAIALAAQIALAFTAPRVAA